MHFDIGIIGGGFSGAAVAYHLIENANTQKRPLSVAIFEPSHKVGSGVAYSTTSPAQILNVPAERMSLTSTAPDSFVLWLKENFPKYGGKDFVPRNLFGQYVTSMLTSASNSAIGLVKLEVIQERVTDLTKLDDGFSLRTDSNRTILVASAVIALGNSPDDQIPNANTGPLLNPWDERALNLANQKDKVAIIGTSLSAFDAILALENMGYRGNYTLISRHGLLPHTHSEGTQVGSDIIASIVNKFREVRSVHAILHLFRKEVEGGTNWIQLIDSLRPHTQEIWQQLKTSQKQSFLRHLRVYWDIHRHRIPAQSLDVVRKLRDGGRLDVLAAKIQNIDKGQGKVKVRIALRHSNEVKSLDFDCVFDCRGLWSDLRRCNSSLIKNLLKSDLAQLDALSRGLNTTTDGEIIDAEGNVTKNLFTLGPTRKGTLWESVAAKEIVQQAQNIAARIISI